MGKATRPFLRTSEFLWQEGHTLHETEEEAQEETLKILSIYEEMAKELLAIPMVSGMKSDKEKFAGAESTYTIEALMHDGKALQSGTSHNLAQHFTKAFDITYLDRNSKLQHPYHTSWGVSTRLIGGLIMVHSDNRGLVLPPRVAPTQVVIVPIMQKAGVLDRANALKADLEKQGIRVDLDDSENYSPGWKFNEYEMKGIPIRIELGPRDIKNGVAMVARRDTLTKTQMELEHLPEMISELLEDIHQDMYHAALEMREEKTYIVNKYESFVEAIKEKQGFYKAMWCGHEACELKIKEDTSATIRCMPFEQEDLGETCIVCGEKAHKMVYLAKAY